MPLVRVEVRNEYGLGAPELYSEANKEDPKAVLDGVAVSGLVGVLRQLGDLAEFAVEIFHGLQEEVMITSSRSHNLVARVRQIEAAVSPLERAVQSQRNHLYFAYTAGSDWHARLCSEQNQIARSGMPQFIMDSYEDCSSAPHLHLLDKFDPDGSGACFKRYSDPAFFKRASGSNDACSDKIANDNKGHKIQKRRSRPRNGDVSRGSSFSNPSGRMQFARPTFNDQILHSRRMSIDDAILRSDSGEPSNLDSRTESVLGPSHSMQPEKQELKESSSSPPKRHHSDSPDYYFVKQKEAYPYDNIRTKLPKEQTCYSSSSITSDEKAEAPQCMPKQYDHNGMTQEYGRSRILETNSLNFDIGIWGSRGLNAGTADEQMHVQLCSDTVRMPKLDNIQLDDIDSETDKFMDALNTVVTDTETDVDCTIKQEHYLNSEDKTIDEADYSECHSSKSQSNILVDNSQDRGGDEPNLGSVSQQCPSAIHASIAEVAVNDNSNSKSLDNNIEISSTRRHGRLLSSGSQQSIDPRKIDSIDHGVNSEFFGSKISSSDLRNDGPAMPVTGRTTSTPESREPEPEPSGVPRVKLWTNGGLLGLKPSTPSDFSVLNGLPQVPVAGKPREVSTSSQCIFSCSDKVAKNPDGMEKNNIGFASHMDCSKSCQDYQDVGASFRKPSWKISPTNLDIKLDTASNPRHQNYVNRPTDNGYAEAAVLLTKSVQPASSDIRFTLGHQENNRSSSRMFELRNLWFEHSNIKLSVGKDVKLGSSCFSSTGVIEPKDCQNFLDQSFSRRSKDPFGGGSQFMSSPSPALEHMKVSFRPVDGFETSKLKLKFHDGNNNHGSDGYGFRSFQLVPEVSTTQHPVSSDSDDDTFYRSSPSLLDDSLSHQSDSNSEEWESRESPSCKENDPHEALHKISLTESASKIRENGRAQLGEILENRGHQLPFLENGVDKHSQSCRLFDRSSLGIRNYSFREELQKNSSKVDLAEPLVFAPTPRPPPLPPAEWRTMKPPPIHIENGCSAISEGIKCALDPTHSTIPQQLKPSFLMQDCTGVTNTLGESKQPGLQKANRSDEASQVACDKKIYQKEDFLNQIRTKSYTLRPTATAKSTVTQGIPANGKVTAILNKANAIRQAVGSDDGEGDDNWSDT